MIQTPITDTLLISRKWLEDVNAVFKEALTDAMKQAVNQAVDECAESAEAIYQRESILKNKIQ